MLTQEHYDTTIAGLEERRRQVLDALETDIGMIDDVLIPLRRLRDAEYGSRPSLPASSPVVEAPIVNQVALPPAQTVDREPASPTPAIPSSLGGRPGKRDGKSTIVLAVGALRATGRPMRPDDIAALIDVPPRTVESALSKYAGQGRFVKRGTVPRTFELRSEADSPDDRPASVLRIEQVANALRLNGKPMHIEAIAEAIGAPVLSVESTLIQNVKRGNVVCRAREACTFGLLEWDKPKDSTKKRFPKADVTPRPRIAPPERPAPIEHDFYSLGSVTGCHGCAEKHKFKSDFPAFCPGTKTPLETSSPTAGE